MELTKHIEFIWAVRNQHQSRGDSYLAKMMKLLMTVGVLVLLPQLSAAKDELFVDQKYGSTDPSCGSLFKRCKNLEYAVKKFRSDQKIRIIGHQEVSSEIHITKSVSIIGLGKATITATTPKQPVFKITNFAVLRLSNLHFNDTSIVSIQSQSYARIIGCSIRHSTKPLDVGNVKDRMSYRRTNGGQILYGVDHIDQASFHLPSAASRTVLVIINSTFIGWQHGLVIQSLRSSSLQLVFENCIFADTLGIYVNGGENSKLSVKNCTFNNMTCTTIEWKAKSKSKGNVLIVSQSTFKNNKGCSIIRKSLSLGHGKYALDSIPGGAISAKSISSIDISNSLFKKCTTGLAMKGEPNTNSYGGAIFMEYIHDKISVRKCEFHGNRADKKGGDIFAPIAPMTVFEHSIFTESSAEVGGSMQITGTNVKFLGCLFTKNSAKNGGAVDLADPRSKALPIFIFTNCTFIKNKAGKDGGALTCKTKGVLNVNFCNFEKNQAYYGGGIHVKKTGVHVLGNQSVVDNCRFIGNKATNGGAIFASRSNDDLQKTSYSIAIRSCQFWNNSATSSGQAVYSEDHIQMENTSVIALEQSIATHLKLGRGTIRLNNLTIQLHRGTQHKLPSNSKGVYFRSNEIKAKNGFTLVCPKNFNVDGLKNITGFGKKIGFSGRFVTVYVDTTVYKYFSAGCTACPSESYHLHSSHLHLPKLSEEYPPENNSVVANEECVSCPTGGICDTGIKSVDNYWGFVDKSSKLSFQLCPGGYCCGSSTVPCVSYDTCAAGRKGTLCGTCSEGYKQNFIGSNCIPKAGHGCSFTAFVTYFILYTVLYTILFIFVTNMSDIMLLVRSTKKKPTAKDENESTDTFSIAGFVQIVILFFQVAGLLQVKFQGSQKNDDDSHGNEIRESITKVFNFKFNVYQRVCPSDDLTLPQKIMIQTGMKLVTFLYLFLLVIIGGALKSLYQQLKYRMSHAEATPPEEPSSELITMGVSEEQGQIQNTGDSTTLSFVNMLKCTFIKLLKLYFTPITKSALMMMHCVPIYHESRLYVYGDHICYSGWQIGIIVILLPGLLLFPICFDIAIRLLKDRLISSWQFVLASICPFYGFLLYVWKRRCSNQAVEKVSHALSDEEEAFRNVILEGEELLFKEVEGHTLGWKIVQFYRTFAIAVISTFLTNPMYRQLAYLCLIVVFINHDGRRNPYKNDFLNGLQTFTSSCLIIVLACNMISSVSYLVNVQNIPYIQEVVRMFGVIELIVFAAVPLTLPIWRLKTSIENKHRIRKEK